MFRVNILNGRVTVTGSKHELETRFSAVLNRLVEEQIIKCSVDVESLAAELQDLAAAPTSENLERLVTLAQTLRQIQEHPQVLLSLAVADYIRECLPASDENANVESNAKPSAESIRKRYNIPADYTLVKRDSTSRPSKTEILSLPGETVLGHFHNETFEVAKADLTSWTAWHRTFAQQHGLGDEHPINTLGLNRIWDFGGYLAYR